MEMSQSKISLVLLSILILMPGSGFLSNLLLLTLILNIYIGLLCSKKYFSVICGLIIFILTLYIFINDSYKFYNQEYYSSLKIIFIFFIFLFLDYFNNFFCRENEISYISKLVSFIFYLSIFNLIIYILFDKLMFSNEKGIAGLSLLLLLFLKFIIERKISYFYFIFVIILVSIIGAFRVYIYIMLISPLFLAYDKKIILLIAVILMSALFMSDIFSDKLHAFSWGIESGQAVGRYAAAAIANSVYNENLLFGYGFGKYHEVYKFFFPYSIVDDVDYSGFSFAEFYVEIGYLVILLYALLFWLIRVRYKYSPYFIFILLVFSGITSTTDKVFLLSIPILLGLYNCKFNEKSSSN